MPCTLSVLNGLARPRTKDLSPPVAKHFEEEKQGILFSDHRDRTQLFKVKSLRGGVFTLGTVPTFGAMRTIM